MPPVYEALLLNTVVPQIQAAQTGDSYVMVVNATTPALRITQTGTGNAISVEDEANPDATPFVVSAAGDVGIGTSSPGAKLDVATITQFAFAESSSAGVRVGTQGTVGGSFMVQTQSASAPYGSGLAIDGTYSSGTLQSTVNIKAFGVYSGGGYGSSLAFHTSSGTTLSQKMLLDSSGNLGLGVTPSAWGSNYRVLDMVQFSTRTAALFGGSGTTGIGLSLGVYHNNSNWIASVSSAPVAVYEINGNGAHTWSTYNGTVTAGNTISFTQVMTLDASGRLLVGTTSNFGGAGQFAIDQGGGTTPVGHLIGTASVGGGQRTVGLNFSGVINDTGPAYGTLAQVGAGKENSTQGNTAGYLSFATIPNGGVLTERARIDSSGNLLVGTTSVGGKLTVEQTGASANGAFITNQTYNYQTLGLHNTATANDNLWVVFGTEASFTGRGSISYNRAGGLTAYNTTSDYRAKDVTGPVANSGATIDALKVYNGKMKGATVERPMLIAHEAQAVTPYAVTGEKDAVDEDGKPKYQQMDVSSLVPLLIAEIQSLRARVAQLEAK